jgi:hypothetical protein
MTNSYKISSDAIIRHPVSKQIIMMYSTTFIWLAIAVNVSEITFRKKLSQSYKPRWAGKRIYNFSISVCELKSMVSGAWNDHDDKELFLTRWVSHCNKLRNGEKKRLMAALWTLSAFPKKMFNITSRLKLYFGTIEKRAKKKSSSLF